ncbi:TRAP transporter small permease [Sediminispirochaeta bajacaliforniensis]|uniref:TRAP transporter small permease n=1 Tax=Sediminispirochaeta bajacaliforniensis TaxID=148 RepID=UPI00036E53BB|nr:TRAP transporter small permease [Sediminispirochaeta bajacaliforniensis]
MRMNQEQDRETKEKLKENTKNVGRIIALVIDWFEVAVLSIGIAALAILLIANVVARTFFQSIYYADEVSKFLIILISFVGVSYAARKARHIRMGAFLDLMPPKLEKIFIFVISAINAVVLLIMAWYGFQYMNQMRILGQLTSALQVPYWTFMIIVPIGFASAGIQYIRTIIKNIAEKDVWLSPEQQSEYEEEGTIGY